MDEKLITTNLKTKKLGRKLELFDVIEYSTNQRVKELINNGVAGFTVVASDLQLGGRGRLGRAWSCGPAGGSLPMSFAVPGGEDLTGLPALTLVIALGVRAAVLNLRPDLSSRLKIKWPNDLLIGKQKVCGILTELYNFEGKNYAIVGIGINTRRKTFPEELYESATSLEIQGGSPENEVLLAEICNETEKHIERFFEKGFLGMVSEYNEALVCRDKEIFASGLEGACLCKGVNERGQLLAEKEGKLLAFDGGEISIRGDFYV